MLEVDFNKIESILEIFNAILGINKFKKSKKKNRKKKMIFFLVFLVICLQICFPVCLH